MGAATSSETEMEPLTDGGPAVGRRKFFARASAFLAGVPALGLAPGVAGGAEDAGSEPLVIARQGSFAAGGSVLQSPGTFDPFVNGGPGQTLHGDHVYTQFQVPLNPRMLPLVMWHGGGQMGKTWESTTDGREGYQSIFLRRGFIVHIIDQPRRGRAGQSTVGTTLVPTPGDQDLFVAWRLGIWPDFYPNTKFPQGAYALDQFFRQMTVDTGPSDMNVVTDGVKALFDRIGPGVLLTHSASGILGWVTAIKSSHVRGLYAYEPTDYVFPVGEVPPALGSIVPHPVSPSDFMQLTKIPIRIQYSDGIPATSSPYPRVQNWVNRLAMGKLMRDAINRHGGDASVLHLPDIGIFGNTHFSFADVNNLEIADILSDWLHQKGLDLRQD
jgi:hypothetical protein